MKRTHALGFLFGLIVALMSASPAFAIDPDKIKDGVIDKGKDWVKDHAKEAGEEWVFGTGQSETMQSIIDAAKDVATEGIYSDGPCRGVVRSQASQVLSDLQIKNTAKNVGRTAFDTLTKVAGLAIGGLGAAAEGGGLSWLAQQYADAAKGAASDAAMDAIRKAFGKDKTPEFEVYEQSGTVGSGPCTYTMRAVWDIAGGTFFVYIFGDCGCKTAQSVSGNRALGKWWVTIYGSMRLVVDKEAKTAKFVPVKPPTLDWDGQCDCSKKELKRPVYKKPPPPSSTTGTTTGGGTNTTPQPPPTQPPPIPPKGRKVCKECQYLQDQIDTDTDALDTANGKFTDAENELQGLNNRLRRDTDQLAAVKASPKDYDISVETVQGRIDADNAAITKAKSDKSTAGAAINRLTEELRGLGVKLEECIKKCGHASMHKETKNALIKFGLEKALDKHHKDDRDREDDQNVHRDDHDQNIRYDDQHPTDDQHQDNDPYH
jgi:hypothetical protein